MKTFIAAVPLFNADMVVEAYRLRFQDGEKLFGLSQNHMALDGAMSSPGVDIISRIGIEPFTGGKPLYVDVNKFLLLADSLKATIIQRSLLICILGKDIPLEPLYLDKIKALKDTGHSIAIYPYALNDRTAPLFELADSIVFDTNKPFWVELKRLRNQFPNLKAILTNVAGKTTFDAMKPTSNALFEGRFYNEPLTVGVKEISPIKTNALQLLKMMGEDDFDLDAASKVIERDTSLALSLLRFINSSAIGLPNKVKSIHNAVAFLGQKETRKWVNAAVSVYLAADKPNEIVKLSLTRARFAENLATAFEMGIHAPSLFLMGLFSLLDVILDKPMSEAIEEIPVNVQIWEALAQRKGSFYEVLRLIYCYEQADWSGVSYSMVLNNIDLNALNDAFIESVVWYKRLLDDIA